MDRFVYWAVPRGSLDGIARVVLCLVAVNLTNLLVGEVLFGEVRNNLTKEIVNTTVVATPFVIGSLMLIAYMHRLQMRLAVMAATDPLTGLDNRCTFMARAEAAATGRDVVMMLDIDRFKQINDRYGHHAGDLCLRRMGAMLRAHMREGDAVGRLGGEEFAVMLSDMPLDKARELGERIAQGIRVGISLEEGETVVKVTLSVGVSEWAEGERLEAVLRRADRALYQAKKAGRARLEQWAAPAEGRAGAAPGQPQPGGSGAQDHRRSSRATEARA